MDEEQITLCLETSGVPNAKTQHTLHTIVAGIALVGGTMLICGYARMMTLPTYASDYEKRASAAAVVVGFLVLAPVLICINRGRKAK